MSTSKWATGLVTSVIALAVLLPAGLLWPSGEAKGTSSTSRNDQVACDQVSAALIQAQKDADKAKAKEAQENLQYLKAREQECASDGETASVLQADGTVVSLPVVDGEDPAHPITGTASNGDPRTPPVRGDGTKKQIVSGWKGLNDVRGSDASYTQCVETRIGISWATQVPKFVQTEQFKRPDGSRLDTRFILAVNTTLSDDAVRATAKKDAADLPANVAIVRVKGFINTRGFNGGDCDPFWDTRSMVRVSLGVVLYDAAGNAIGLDSAPDGSRARGVFVDCHNPWLLARRLPPPPPPAEKPRRPRRPTPTPTPPPTVPPTPTPKPSKSQSEDCMLNGDPNCPPNGGNQPPSDNPAPAESNPPEPPPSDRPQGDPNGGNGPGEASASPSGPTDDSDSEEETNSGNQQECPMGPGNC